MKQKILMLVFVLVLGSILTSALIWVDAFTGPMIKKNKALKLKKSILEALNIEADAAAIEAVFDANIKELKKDTQTFYISGDGNIAFQIFGKGLWGPIIGVVAVFPDHETVYGITIIHQEETPGLGGRIGEAEFLERFRKKKLGPGLAIVAPGKAKADNEIDGISGATMSCDAFELILNDEIKKNLALIVELKK